VAESSGKQRGKPFQPGQSGNPGGRPKLPDHVRDAARAHTEKAITVLAECLDDADARVRVTAANSILDRGWGKPAQTLDVTHSDDTAEMVREVIARLRGEPKSSAAIVVLAEASATALPAKGEN
jgi:hypothetical protein